MEGMPSIKKLAEGPVHGSNHPHYTPEQKADVEALLSTVGTGVKDPLLDTLPGETVVDMEDYLAAKPRSEERTAAAERIKARLNEAAKQYYEGREAA